MPLAQIAGLEIEKHEGSLEIARVQDPPPAAEIRMFAMTAIGHHQAALLRNEGEVVRAKAMGRPFPDAMKAGSDIVDPDHPAGIVEIILGCVEQRAIRREDAVAVEMPVLRRMEDPVRLSAINRQADGEGTRPTGEHDGDAVHRAKGEVMAAPGEDDLAEGPSRPVKDRRAELALGDTRRRTEERPAASRFGPSGP